MGGRVLAGLVTLVAVTLLLGLPAGASARPSDRAADHRPPQTHIVAGPRGSVTSTVARFSFRSTERASTFKCALDGRTRRCTSPRRFAKLRPGRHSFTVRARDRAGNHDPTPARRFWTVRRASAAPRSGTSPERRASAVPEVAPAGPAGDPSPGAPPSGDTVAPGAPTGLRGVGTPTATTLQVAWAAPADADVAHYEVLRDGDLVGVTGALTQALSGLACATPYAIAVITVDRAGNRSPAATTTLSTAACPEPPPPPPANALYVAPGGSDTAPCSAAAPCRTFDRGYHAAAPGQVVVLRGGTYPGQTITVDASKSGASEDVVLQPAAGEIVTIDGLLSISGSRVALRGGVGPYTLRGQKVYIDPIATPTSGANRTNHVTVENFDGQDFVIGPARDVLIAGGDWGPSVGCSDTTAGGEFENKVSASTALPGISPENITIDGALIHDQNTSNPQACHQGGLLVTGAVGLTIRNSRFWKNTIYDIEFDDFTGSFPLHGITIENNWFGPPVYVLPNDDRAFEVPDIQVKWNGVPAVDWLVRYNSFGFGFAPEWDGGPPSYSGFRVVANTGVTIWDGSHYETFAACGKPGTTYAFNAFGAIDNLGSSGGARPRCAASDVYLGRTTGSYNLTAGPYVSTSVTALDYRLAAGSLARDAVTAMTADAMLGSDIFGVGRPQGAAPDAGATEG